MILTEKAIESLEAVKKTHFLNNKAIRNSRSLGDAAGLQNLGVHLIQVEPGHYSTERHTHHYEEECLLILSGQATAFDGNEETAVSAGDFLAYPCHGPAHSLLNSGTERLICLVIGQRLDYDITDYPDKKKRLFRHQGSRSLVNHSDIETP